MPRPDFDAPVPYRGGALSVPDKPAVKRYPCFADQCPMPGSIFASGTDKAGACAWHYGVLPNDIPKVTRVLLDWQCVSSEVNAARRLLTGPAAADAKAQDEAFASAWNRLQGFIDTTWQAELKPGNARTSKGEEHPFREGYGDWAKRLERFLGARVVEVLSTHHQRRA